MTATDPNSPALTRRRSKTWIVCAAALLSFGAGSLITAGVMRTRKVQADANRVFELRIYHALPGKGQALESVFRDGSKLFPKYGVNVLGFWVPTEDPAWKDTFIYLVAHPSRDEATKNWKAVHSDPEFPQYRDAAALLIQKTGEEYQVDEIFMRPSDFSPMK
jgi:hypothetical protein